MRANSTAKFISLNNIVGSDCDQPAIRNLELAVELKKPLMLSTFFWTKAAATEDENHWIVLLKLRKFPAFCRVVRKLIIREDSAWNNIESHLKGFSLCDCVSSEIAFQDLPESGHGLNSGPIA